MKRAIQTLTIDYLVINLGLIIAAAGIGLFLVPAKLVTGGLSGIATILHYHFNAPVGMTMLVINIPLFLLGVKFFGKSYGAKTLFGIFMLSFYIDLFPKLVRVSDFVNFNKGSNYLLAPLFGGILLGIGLGLVLKFGGSTGGTDIVAQIVNKFTNLPMGYCMMINDFIIICTGMVVFGVERGLYAIVAMFTINVVINKIFDGADYNKLVYIISDHHEEIRNLILVDLNRGGTFLQGRGMYTRVEKNVIMVVLGKRDMRDLQALVKRIDEDAFIIVTDVHEVMGVGFTLPK